MSRRAIIAQYRAEMDPSSLSDRAGRASDRVERGDERHPTLDHEYEDWSEPLLRGRSADDGEPADEAPTETKGLDDLLDHAAGVERNGRRVDAPSAERPVERRAAQQIGSFEREEQPAVRIGRADSSPSIASAAATHSESRETRPRRNGESVWDAVEERYQAEGHWDDLLDMYMQRVEGTHDTEVKGSLFMRIGLLMRDEMNDPQQALDAFVEALVLDPRNADALVAVEAIARERGWWLQLLATFRRELGAIQEDDERAVLLSEIAIEWAEGELGALARAEPFLAHIRQIDPGHPMLHTRLAAAYGENGAWDLQRESLQRALVRARDDEERLDLHLQLGELNEQRFGEYTEAGKHFECALEIDPRLLRALQGLERICRLQDRFGDLVGVLERQSAATDTDEARIEILLRLADLHERFFGKPDRAAAALEEVIRIDPRHAAALSALERCYEGNNAWGELVAVLELRARMSDRPGEPNVLLARVAEILELNMGDPARATVTWQRAWDIDPANEHAVSELARLAETAGDWSAAAAYKAKLADLAPTPEAAAKAHVAVAELLAAPDRDPKLARVHYEKAVTLHPGTTEAWEALERDARSAGDWRRAGLFLEKRAASTESPVQKAQLFIQLAEMQRAAGDTEGAELACERALRADPTNEVAAEAMLDAYVRDQRWAEASSACDVLLEATPGEVNPERAFALCRLATRIACELGLWERAFGKALAAHHAFRSVESGSDLIQCAFTMRHDTACMSQCAADLDDLAKAGTSIPPDLVVKLAHIRSAQGAEDDALALFSDVLARDPDEKDALAGLADLLVRRENWGRASAVKQQLARAVGDTETQFGLLVEAGDLWSKRARNMPMAALVYEEALAIKPRDHGLLHTLLWVYGELSCWEKLLETLRSVAELHEGDRPAKAKSVYAMAMVARDKLGDLRKSAILLEETIDVDVTRLDAFERIVRIHTELRDWMELKHAYGRMLRRLRSGGEVELRYALFFQLGLVYRDRLGDAARALDAFRAAQRIKPDENDVRKGMVELFVVTDQLDEGVSMVRAALKKRPLDQALYGELYELFLRKHAYDRAWCALDALVALGATLTAEQSRFYGDYPPPTLAEVPGTLAAVAWRSHVLHQELDSALTAILALVTPAVLRTRIAVVPFQQLRRSLGDPLKARDTIVHEVVQTVADACEILGFPTPSLHLKKGQTIPLTLAPAKSAMFVSIEACEALPSDALAFVVGKRLAELRPELTARAACPSAAELRGLLQIASQLAEPSGAPSTSEFDQVLAQSITRDELTGLKAALAAARAQGSDLDVVRWSNLADASTARIGLLLAGRIDAAKRGMTTDVPTGSDLSANEKLGQLLIFSVSEEYADLRRAIGVGVGANAAA